MKEQFTAVFQQVPEGYIGFVEELPGVNTQGETLDETRTNLHEAVQLVLESNRALAEASLRHKTVIREPLALFHEADRPDPPPGTPWRSVSP